MTLQIGLLIFVTFAFAFIFSVSVIVNVILTGTTLVGIWYFRNSITERSEMLSKLEEFEQTKHMIKNIEQIGSHVLQLKYLLEEVKRSNVMYNEPIYNDLMEITNNLLQDIYIFDEVISNEETQE